MPHRRRSAAIAVVFILCAAWILSVEAHHDPCHRHRSCPSETGSYVCGDKGRCDQWPDYQYCLAGKPRVAVSPIPAPVPPAPTATQPSTSGGTTVCFTPGGNCTDHIVQAITGAKTSMLVQAYSFTSAPIAIALLDAHKRGVQVEVILDKSQRTEQYSSADFLANQGVPTLIDAKHTIAHHKVMVIDGETAIRGSFNFTKTVRRRTMPMVVMLGLVPLLVISMAVGGPDQVWGWPRARIVKPPVPPVPPSPLFHQINPYH